MNKVPMKSPKVETAPFLDTVGNSISRVANKQNHTLSDPSAPAHSFGLPEGIAAAEQLSLKAGTAETQPDLSDLPEEVRNQLTGYGDIELQNQLIDCLQSQGGKANVDKLIIALWYRHKRKDVTRIKAYGMLNELATEGTLRKYSSPRGTYEIIDSYATTTGINNEV